MKPPAPIALVLLALLAWMPALGHAQPCGPGWLPGESFPGASETVNASVMWDPDGSGPATARMVIAGRFTAVASVAAPGVAVHDPATGTWSTLGSNLLGGEGSALAAMPNGDLVVAGEFLIAGNAERQGLVRWNGTSWSPVGPTPVEPLTVNAVVALPSGDLIVGGNFTSIAGVAAANLARWNGTAWSQFWGANGRVLSLRVTSGGTLFAGGDFTSIGGSLTRGVAQFLGIGWAPLGTGVDGPVHVMEPLPNGDLIVGGEFEDAGNVEVNNVARWTGSTWEALGTGTNGPVSALAARVDGIFVGGTFGSAGGVANTSRLARWIGFGWASIAGSSQITEVRALLAVPNGPIAVGGTFQRLGGVAVRNFTFWNGSTYSAVGSGLSGPVRDLAVAPNGDVLAAGDFRSAGGAASNGVARWNGASWLPLGTSIEGTARSVALLPNGDVVAGGQFTSIGGVSASNIARWNGTAWLPLGTGVPGAVNDIVVLPNGDLVVGGEFSISGNRVARWNGSSWSALGTGPDGPVFALALLPNGDVIAGGRFERAGGQVVNSIARWNGQGWLSLGSGMQLVGVGGTTSLGQVFSLAALPGGAFVAAGFFVLAGGTSANNLARWEDGLGWSAVGDLSLFSSQAVGVSASGNILGVGDYSDTGPPQRDLVGLFQWTGSAWALVGPRLGPVLSLDPVAERIVTLPSGEVAVGGNPTVAGDDVSAHFARYSFTGAPTMTSLPIASQTLQPGQTATLTASPADGYRGVSVRWLRNGANISNGPGGASAGGGTVSGASGGLASPTNDATATLTITNAQAGDSGVYGAVFTNACGNVASAPATVTVGSGAGAVGPSIAYLPVAGTIQGMGGPVNLPAGAVGGAPGTANIVATPSGGSGGGTTTVGACTVLGASSAAFSAPAGTLTFTAGTTTSQNLVVGCVRAAGALAADLRCTETIAGAGTFDRFWRLSCPAGTVAPVGPTLAYSPTPGTTVSFPIPGTVGANVTANIAITPSGGVATASTTLGSCVLGGANPGAFAVLAILPLTFQAPGTGTPTPLAVRCTTAATAQAATLTCQENVGPSGTNTVRTWPLSCPVEAVFSDGFE